MMLLQTEFAEVIGQLGNPCLVVSDTVIPEQWPAVDHSPYRSGYDWLFKYERKLFRYLEQWFAEQRSELIGPGGLISEALSNAYCHGNRGDPTKAIEIKVLRGSRGFLLSITDSGDGFDLPTLLENFTKGKKYYQVAGNGFKHMDKSAVFGVFYSRGGTTFHLVCPVDKTLLPGLTTGTATVETPPPAPSASAEAGVAAESIAPGVAVPEPVPPEAAAVEPALHPEQRQQTIDLSSEFDQIIAAVIADGAGSVLASANGNNIQQRLPDYLDILSSARCLTKGLDFGAPSSITIRTDTVQVYIHSEGETRILVAAVTGDAHRVFVESWIENTLQSHR